MKSSSLVELALSAQGCSQKELAIQLGVSPAQISKWKKGEHISFDMSNKLSELAGLNDLDADFVLLAGSKEDAKNGYSLSAALLNSPSGARRLAMARRR